MTFFRHKHPGFLLFCLFIVMIGYGLTLPVLAFDIERLALANGSSIQKAYLHVGVLTGVFALMQFFFAPLWGRLSDRVGRRPLFMTGLAGYAVSMLLFGIGTNLLILYVARILGGIFGAAVLPVASAYVADTTSESDRGKGMARLSSAIGFGVVTGPALGGFLSRLDLHFKFGFGHFRADDFSTPFFAAAILAIISLFAAVYLIPESLQKSETGLRKRRTEKYNDSQPGVNRLVTVRTFRELLILSFLGYFALSLFEGTFALHGKSVMNFGPRQMGAVFMVCGLVMAVAQIGVVGRLIGRVGEKPLLSPGFVLMGGALFLLMTTHDMALILFYVSLLAVGMALINPSLSSLVSKNAGELSGTALGMQSSAISLGQTAGPVVGGLLFVWNVHVPYLLAAVLLTGTAIILISGIKKRS
ncbi:MAG: MFS transporter [Nitrospiraceae bacterium]|nr:MFS transporter [Nitrospiraceae bacterium]